MTAGPGITNALTGIAGAWQESRELLVIGGQVKSSDLSRGAVRQRGIQEIDGVELVRSVTKRAMRIERPVARDTILEAVLDGRTPRQGPVFLEVCLDAQAAPPLPGQDPVALPEAAALPQVPAADVEQVVAWVRESERPVILVGGGVSRGAVRALSERTAAAGIPLMTTWNGADRVPTEHPLYSGRPNTWGQRAANILIQQADLVIAVGTRLGLQQTGFAWEEFVPVGRVVQVDIDAAELDKGHPRVDLALRGDADRFLAALYASDLGDARPVAGVAGVHRVGARRAAAQRPAERHRAGVREALRVRDAAGRDRRAGCDRLAVQQRRLIHRRHAGPASCAPSRSSSANKSLASMGYGLSGAIGAALANPGRQVFLSEGDGGFAQNLQELGTLAATGANVKVFLLNNNGYASIRMTQRNYFEGAWIGCDAQTGLGLPSWEDLARAYRIPFAPLDARIRPGCPGGPLAAGSGRSGAHRGAHRPGPDLLPEDQFGGAARRLDEVEPAAPDESRPAGRCRAAGDRAPRRCCAAGLDCELSAIRVIRIPSPRTESRIELFATPEALPCDRPATTEYE